MAYRPQSNWTVGSVNAGETNAVVSVKFTLPSAVQFQWAGCNKLFLILVMY